MFTIENGKLPIITNLAHSFLIIRTLQTFETTANRFQVSLQTFIVEVAFRISPLTSTLPEQIYVYAYVIFNSQTMVN